MMVFLLFIIVFAITYTNGIARPMTASGIKFVSRNGVNDDLGDGTLFRLPTTITLGMSITIQGVLNATDEMFSVIFHDSDDANEDCKIILDFETDMFNVTPAIDSYESASYDLRLKTRDKDKINFSLAIIPRQNNYNQDMLAVYFQVNDEGDSPELPCYYKNFKKITHIEMQAGVSEINSLLFEFK